MSRRSIDALLLSLVPNLNLTAVHADDPDTIVAAIDATDPDNLAQVTALTRLFPNSTIHVLLTGRPVHEGVATAETQTWEYSVQASLNGQRIAATRIRNFLVKNGIEGVQVFNGGIAPRTLVPHRFHFNDGGGFGDVDVTASLASTDLHDQGELIKLLLSAPSFAVTVGGPFTGLAQLITHEPALAAKINAVTFMGPTWGTNKGGLMDLDGKGADARGPVQFNVACDPVAAKLILENLSCPIFLMPSDVTRLQSVGFENPEALRAALPDTTGARELVRLYEIWYPAALQKRGEWIYIHDLVSALALNPFIRDRIYQMVPVTVTEVVAFRPTGDKKLGQVSMAPTDQLANIFAATELQPGGAEVYREVLHFIFE